MSGPHQCEGRKVERNSRGGKGGATQRRGKRVPIGRTGAAGIFGRKLKRSST